MNLIAYIGITLCVCGTVVQALQCRYALLERTENSRRTLRRSEGSITCSDENSVCARVHIKGYIGDEEVSMHAASCLDRKDCEDQCPLGFLEKLTWDHPLTNMSECKTKCCHHDNCNKHTPKRKTIASKKPISLTGEPLRCHTGEAMYDGTGKELKHVLDTKECLYSAKGPNRELESRCLYAEIVTRNLSSKSLPYTTKLYHCARTEMCEDTSCRSLENFLREGQGEEIVMDTCNLTCCDTPYCNRSKMAAVFNPLLLILVLSLERILLG